MRGASTRAILVTAFLCMAVFAHATAFVWNNAGTSGTWGTTTNWTPNGTPGAGDTVTISNGGTCNIDGNVSCLTITITNGNLGVSGLSRSLNVFGNANLSGMNGYPASNLLLDIWAASLLTAPAGAVSIAGLAIDAAATVAL